MLKICITALVGLVTISVSYAQIGIGIKGGGNVARCIGGGCDDEDIESLAKLGYHVGLVGNIIISQRFDLQVEVLYSTQGARSDPFTIESDNPDTDGIPVKEVIIRNNYLNLPVMLKFYPLDKLYIHAGLYLGLLLESTSETVFPQIQSVPGGSLISDTKDLFNDLDLGIGGGIGYNFGYRLTAEARYQYGLSDTSAETSEAISRNTLFQLSLLYRIIKHRD
ncbi:MAG: porin family protein [Bacteroidota bacterium]